jgi:hypothetical protein
MLESLLAKISFALERHGITYMVVGGQAVLIHGEPRLTRDVDITLGTGPEQVGVMLDILASFGWRVLVDDPVDFVRKTMVLPCVEPESGLRIDFIFSFTPYEREALKRAIRVNLDGTDIRFASVEDLIIHKVFAGRPRDLEDVRGILLKNKNLDLAYLRHWLKDFDHSVGEGFSDRFEELYKRIGNIRERWRLC